MGIIYNTAKCTNILPLTDAGSISRLLQIPFAFRTPDSKTSRCVASKSSSNLWSLNWIIMYDTYAPLIVNHSLIACLELAVVLVVLNNKTLHFTRVIAHGLVT